VSDAPLGPADLAAIARRIHAYWGTHLYVRVVPGSTPQMDWRDVHVPPEFGTWSRDRLTSILLHEWGHRTISPISPLRGRLWQQAARRAGLMPKQAHMVANIAADAWVDRACLENPDWGEVFRRGEEETLAELVARTGSPPDSTDARALRFGRLLVAFQRLILDSTGDTASTAPAPGEGADEVQECARRMWDILMTPEAAEVDKVADLARLLQNWLPPEPDPRLLLSALHDFARRVKRLGELTERLLEEARRAGLGDAEIEEAFGRDELERLRLQAERLRLYARVVPVVKKFMAQRARMSFAGYRSWRVGRPVRELDLLATLQRSSILIPSVNTLSQHLEPRGSQVGRGRGGAILVVDDSGSTSGNVLAREKEAAFAIVAAARSFGDPVSLVAFGSRVTRSIPLTSNYAQVEEAVCRLDSGSGGTALAPALEEALRHGEGLESFAVMVMTDGEVGDSEDVGLRLRAFPPAVRTVAFCFNHPKAVRESLARPAAGRVRVLAASPAVPFAEAALEEVYGN
jgi:hypothetical protein